MKPKKLTQRLSEPNPFGIEIDTDNAFEGDEFDDDEPTLPPKCNIIRYDSVSYACLKVNTETCKGYCPLCSYGVRI